MKELYLETKAKFDQMVGQYQKNMNELKEFWDDAGKFAKEAKKKDDNPWYLFECRKSNDKNMRNVFSDKEIKQVAQEMERFSKANTLVV